MDELNLRKVTEDDRKNLPTMSYSKLDMFINCPKRFQKRYMLGKRPEGQTISLELGSILHKGLEMKGNYILSGESVDYDAITKAVMDGCDEETEKNSDHIHGVNEIKTIYFEDWMKSFEDSVNYQQKIELYMADVLPTRMEDVDWEIVGVEIPFEYVYNDQCIVHGFIDRIDRKKDAPEVLKVVDYKTSKKVFPDNKIKTPLQMIIYDLACKFMYGVLPQHHEYDFVLLNEKQTTEDGVCSKGYLKRGLKKIDDVLGKIKVAEATNEFPPYPSPLCYWCSFPPMTHTPNADKQFSGDCQYYSLWTPEHKQYAVNEKYIPGEPEKEQRKLVF